MNRETVIETLKGIIEPFVQNKSAFENLSEDTDLVRDLDINSTDLVDIILDVEDAFKIEIDDEAAEKMSIVGSALDVILEKIKNR